MDNQPAQIQKIRWVKMPRKKNGGNNGKGRTLLHIALGFVLGAAVCWGVNLWLNSRPEQPKQAAVQERPVLTSGKRGINPYEGTKVLYNGKPIDYGKHFKDANAKHLEAAAAVGLAAIPEDREAVMKMKTKMVPIRDCKNYLVDPLTHSVPYLCPGAARELDAIGDAWAELLKRNDLPHYRFILTSVLRTQEDVKKLQKSGNVNASDKSAHCYGTTFDITYTRFEKGEKSDNYMVEDNLKLALAQILLNEQRAGNIYVKYEKKQACFHITSRL